MKEFYEEKLNETSQRMEVLIESVETSGLNLNIRHHKRSQSLIESITRKWGSMISHHGNNLRVVREQSSDLGPSSPSPRYSGVPDLAKIFSESVDDEDDVQKRKKKEELMRKEDSIKRALTDIYRTAKLLHNYSIMVSLLIDIHFDSSTGTKSVINIIVLSLQFRGGDRITQDLSSLRRSLTRHFLSIRACLRGKYAMMGNRLSSLLLKW